MNKQLLFSIIIPVYNVQDYLEQCLNSVLNQTFQHYEIILIDDGSSDNSSQICVQYALKHPQITLLKQPNQGVSVARNRGIQLARGEYLMFLDSDDYWCDQQALSNLAQIIQDQPTIDIIFYPTTIEFIQENHKIKEYYYDTNHLSLNYQQDFLELVRRKIFISTACTKVLKHQIIMQHHIRFPENKRFEDVAFYFELAPYIQHYHIYNQPFYYYRFRRAGSTSASITPLEALNYLEIVHQCIGTLKQFYQAKHPLWLGLFQYWQNNFHHVIHYHQQLDAHAQQIATRKMFDCIQTANQLQPKFEQQIQQP